MANALKNEKAFEHMFDGWSSQGLLGGAARAEKRQATGSAQARLPRARVEDIAALCAASGNPSGA